MFSGRVTLPESYKVILKRHLIPGQDGDREAELEEAGQGEQVAAKQVTKKRPQKKTVEQNLSNINLSESEMKCEVNSMIEKCLQVQYMSRIIW